MKKGSSADDLEQYRSRCTRFLLGHGNRSAADLIAAIPTDLGLDRYGAGGAVGALEAEVRKILGKPAAAFMPGGTMAQQIALRIHADRRGSRVVAWHPTCHLEIHEDKAYQRMHGLVGVNVGSPRSLMTLESLRAIPEKLAAVLFELPQREIGGRLPSWDELREQVDHVRSRGAAAHMDGARLWESTTFYGKTPKQVAALFDSVYVSFYKGLGALAGACLAGDEDFIAEARAWRKRHGGTLFGMWPNAASALAGLRQRLPLMPRYVEHARAIAAELSQVDGLEVVPDPPQTPMFHLLLRGDGERLGEAALAVAEERKVFLFAEPGPTTSPGWQRHEVMVGEPTLQLTPAELRELYEEILARAAH